MTTNMSHLLKGLSLSLVRSGSKPGYAWVVSQFAPWSKDLLCVLCESLAFFAVKFFFTAKLAKNVAKNAKPNPRTIALRPLRILGVLRCEVLLSPILEPDCRQSPKAQPRTCFAHSPTTRRYKL